MKESKIFTPAELKSLRDRAKGVNKDDHGLFSARVRPKIVEILTYWLPRVKALNTLLVVRKPGRKKK